MKQLLTVMKAHEDSVEWAMCPDDFW
jgi:hypothetical protein